MIGEVKNIGNISKVSWREKIRYRARELRKNQTPSEVALWKILRNRKLSGRKFYRQQPIIHFFNRRPYYFIADFFCYELKLVIEIDGKVHDHQQDYDTQRTLILEELGITVLRIKNEELNNIQAVINKIIEHL